VDRQPSMHTCKPCCCPPTNLIYLEVDSISPLHFYHWRAKLSRQTYITFNAEYYLRIAALNSWRIFPSPRLSLVSSVLLSPVPPLRLRPQCLYLLVIRNCQCVGWLACILYLLQWPRIPITVAWCDHPVSRKKLGCIWERNGSIRNAWKLFQKYFL